MTNLERLALLLQRVTGVEAGKTPEETIKRAVQEIKASKNTDQQVKSQLSKVKLSEEEMYGGAEELPTLTDYVRNKFAGEPSTKSWAEIEFANIGRLDDLKKRQLYKKKITDYNEDVELDPRDFEDNEFDAENGIEFKSIDDFMNNLSVVDYLDIYDDDELDFSEFDDVDPSEIETGDSAELKECEDIIASSINAKELTEAGQTKEAQALLEFAVSCRADSRSIFTQLADLYRQSGQADLIHGLIDSAEKLPSLDGPVIAEKLKAYLP